MDRRLSQSTSKQRSCAVKNSPSSTGCAPLCVVQRPGGGHLELLSHRMTMYPFEEQLHSLENRHAEVFRRLPCRRRSYCRSRPKSTNVNCSSLLRGSDSQRHRAVI